MQVEIMNKIWEVKDLQFISSTERVKELVLEYKKDPNCRAYDFVIGENIPKIEKASFIYTVLNK